MEGEFGFEFTQAWVRIPTKQVLNYKIWDQLHAFNNWFLIPCKANIKNITKDLFCKIKK